MLITPAVVTRISSAVLAMSLLAGGASQVHAEAATNVCQTVSIQFQPVAYPPSKDPKGVYEAGGPQFAIWLADATGKWVADIAVTRMTAIFGIGNRPGVWNFASSPKFPYGRRLFDLPVWAYSRAVARNHWYKEVVMSQGQPETTFGFHESISSNEPYYCRPLRPEEQVDAVTCPTPRFTSCKGEYADRPNPYPPRNDVSSLEGRDDPSVRTFAGDNDVDVVATATPTPGRTNPAMLWTVPPDLAPGDYVVFVEVNKEYDQNDTYQFNGQIDTMGLSNYGNGNNLGMPSLVWKVPIKMDEHAKVAITKDPVGYGAPTPMDAAKIASIHVAGDAMSPIDGTITEDVGSGLGRLGLQMSAEGMWKVRVETTDCGGGMMMPQPGVDGGPVQSACDLTEAPDPVPDFHVTDLKADSAVVEFTQTASRGPNGTDVRPTKYDVRFRQGTSMTQEEFEAASPAPAIEPASRGTAASVELLNLKPDVDYIVGLRINGACRKQSSIQTASFKTTSIKFKTVEGCFVATAAYGSALEPEVEMLRRFRDRVLLGTVPGRMFTAFYYQASPALAGQLRRAEWARGLARLALAPLVDLARLGLRSAE